MNVGYGGVDDDGDRWLCTMVIGSVGLGNVGARCRLDWRRSNGANIGYNYTRFP